MDEAVGRGATLSGTVLGPSAGALLAPDTARSSVAVEAPAGALAARRATSHKVWMSAWTHSLWNVHSLARRGRH